MSITSTLLCTSYLTTFFVSSLSPQIFTLSQDYQIFIEINFLKYLLVIILPFSVAFNTISLFLILETLSLAWMIPSSPGFSPTSVSLFTLLSLPTIKCSSRVLVLAAESWSFFSYFSHSSQANLPISIVSVTNYNSSCSSIYVFLAQINLLNPGTEYTSLLTFPVDSLYIHLYLTNVNVTGSSSPWK